MKNRLTQLSTRALIRRLIELDNERMWFHFMSLGDNRYFYSEAQKQYALSQIDEYGIRATTRILGIPRVTIQRWCREHGKRVKRCPYWSERRRKRQEFWQRGGVPLETCCHLKRGEGNTGTTIKKTTSWCSVSPSVSEDCPVYPSHYVDLIIIVLTGIS